jgi:hypothetical protein
MCCDISKKEANYQNLLKAELEILPNEESHSLTWREHRVKSLLLLPHYYHNDLIFTGSTPSPSFADQQNRLDCKAPLCQS